MTRAKARRRRPAPKKKKVTKKIIKKSRKRVVKPVLPDLCNAFACKEPAEQFGFCANHKLTPDDIAFRQRLYNAAWMIKEGVPALRKLARDYPAKKVAPRVGMM